MYNEYKKRYLCKDVGETVFPDLKIATASDFLSEADLKIIDQIKLPEKILPEFWLGDFSSDFEDIEDELTEYFGKYLIIGKADFTDDIVVLITEDRDVVKYDKSSEDVEYINDCINSFMESVFEYTRFIEEMNVKYNKMYEHLGTHPFIEEFLCEEDIEALKDRLNDIEEDITVEDGNGDYDWSYWKLIVENLNDNMNKSVDKDLDSDKKEKVIQKSYNLFQKNQKEYSIYRNGELFSTFKYDEKGNTTYIKTKIWSSDKGDRWKESFITTELDSDGRKEFVRYDIHIENETEKEYKTVRYTYNEFGDIDIEETFESIRNKGRTIRKYEYEYENGKKKSCTIYGSERLSTYIDGQIDYDEKGNITKRVYYSIHYKGDEVTSSPQHTYKYEYNEYDMLTLKQINDDIFPFEYEVDGDQLTRYVIKNNERVVDTVFKCDSEGKALEAYEADGKIKNKCSYWG